MTVSSISRTASLVAVWVVSMANSNVARADQAQTRPETVKVTAGNVVTRIEAAKMWTISGLEYHGHVMATEDSAYGSVITLTGYGHLGTAHFLEVPGNPNAVEKENVIDWNLFIDGKPVTAFTSKTELKGESFRMERQSSIRALQLQSTVEIRDDVVMESARYKTDVSIQLDMTYPLMYAWSPSNTDYVFGDDEKIVRVGSFLGQGEKPTEGLEKNVRWMAVYDKASGKGSVLYLLQHPQSADGWFQYTDAPGIYRKLRIMSFVKQTVPAGFDGTYQSIVGFFEADEPNWQAKAQKRAADLKAYAAKVKK